MLLTSQTGEAVKISDMAHEEQPEISIKKNQELLVKAQLLLKDIEELLDSCASAQPSNQRQIQQEHQDSTEQDIETLVMDGIRFESAASWEDLRRLSSQAAGAGGRQGDT
ncbi:hypothetical protein PFLUV_G00081960 [Xyrichtys novacula]|uniref:Uncharacterized protein n=1 Tax=Xyrichtys novacula TaxID=13765 RepID=A0AAV1FLD9_XYRNO|nr:hypothetical protein PFLUV_G00081960 [Xyrichtys novacula]